MERLYGAQGSLRRWTNWIALVGAVGIMLIAATIVIDVIARWVFNSPILGVDDLSKFSVAIVISSFFPICLVGGHFVTIRFVGKALGQRANLWLEVFGGLVTLFIFCLFAWQFFRFTLFDVTLTGLATVVLEVPQAPWWWIVTTIISLCVPIQLAVLYHALYDALRGEASFVTVFEQDHETSI